MGVCVYEWVGVRVYVGGCECMYGPLDSLILTVAHFFHEERSLLSRGVCDALLNDIAVEGGVVDNSRMAEAQERQGRLTYQDKVLDTCTKALNCAAKSLA